MSPEFDVKWLSLSFTSSDGLDEVVAAEKRAPEVAPQDGRFEALLASHLRWASTSRGSSTGSRSDASRDALPGEALADMNRSSRVAKEVSEQLARLAEVGVTA